MGDDETIAVCIQKTVLLAMGVFVQSVRSRYFQGRSENGDFSKKLGDLRTTAEQGELALRHKCRDWWSKAKYATGSNRKKFALNTYKVAHKMAEIQWGDETSRSRIEWKT